MRTLLILPAMLAASPALALDHGRDAVRDAAAAQALAAGVTADALHHRARVTQGSPTLTLGHAEAQNANSGRDHLTVRMAVKREGDAALSQTAYDIERRLQWETPLIAGFELPSDRRQSSASE